MIWVCIEEGCEVYGWSEGVHIGGWCDKGRYRGQGEMEMDELLW